MDVCKRRPILSCACRKGRFLGKPVVIVHDEVWLPYRDQSGWIMTSLIYSIFLLIFLLLLAMHAPKNTQTEGRAYNNT